MCPRARVLSVLNGASQANPTDVVVRVDVEHASWHFLAKEALKATLPCLSPVDNLPSPVELLIID
jgi:hypothetical protein